MTTVGPAKTLLIAVTEYLDEHYPDSLPAALRMEMRPSVYYAIMNDADTYSWPREPGDSGEEMLTRTFTVPVRIVTDLPDGTWRLVVVTEDVLLGGGLP
jgi:hypothetical protein